MRYLLCLVAIVVSEAARIPRGLDPHFPSFHSVYHGHGATSYQNVQLQSHGNIPVPSNYEIGHASELDLAAHHEHEDRVVVPIVESHKEPEHIAVSTIAPYDTNDVQQIEYQAVVADHPQYYQQYEQDHDNHQIQDHYGHHESYNEHQDYELVHDYH